MEKYLLRKPFCLLALALLPLSCVKEELDGNQPAEKTVTLHLSIADATKTYLQNDVDVCWHSGDNIVINNRSYEIQVNPGNPLEATVTDVIAADSYYALYGSLNYRNGDCYPEIQKYQSFTLGTFAQYENPMAAYSTSTSLSFKNLGAVPKVTLINDDDWDVPVSSVRLISNSGLPISGTLQITADDIVSGAYLSAEPSGFGPSYVVENLDYFEQSSAKDFYFVTSQFKDENGVSFLIEMDGSIWGDTMGELAFYYEGSHPFEISCSELRTLPALYMWTSDFYILGTERLESTSNSISFAIEGKEGMRIRYVLLEKTAWDSFKGWAPDEEMAMEDIICNSRNEYTIDELGYVELTFTEAYLDTGGTTGPLESGRDYVLLLDYSNAYGATVWRTVSDANRLIVDDEPLALDVNVVETRTDAIDINIVSNATAIAVAAVPSLLFYYYDYSNDLDGAFGKYGQSLNASQIQMANSTGCLYSPSYLVEGVDYEILVKAVSAAGNTVISRVYAKTDYDFFDPETTSLELISETAQVTAELFLGECNNQRLYKVPGIDVFVLKNFYKDNLLNSGIEVEEGDFYTVIDARDPAAVRMDAYGTRLGVKYFPEETETSCPVFMGDYLSLNSGKTEYVGTYDAVAGTIDFPKVLLAPIGPYLYGLFSMSIIIEPLQSSMTTEDFKKVNGAW